MNLAELIDLENKINVVDVGASSITGDGDPPYKPLLDSGIAEVIGFDLNLDAISELNLRKGKKGNYLPYAVYDGKQQELKICGVPAGNDVLFGTKLRVIELFLWLS